MKNSGPLTSKLIWKHYEAGLCPAVFGGIIMKLIIASDLHGSAYWCGKLMDLIQQEQPDKLVLLGDLLYHGPRNDLPRDYAPKQVIPMLSELKDRIIAVRGNCEAEVDQMVLEFPVLADYCILYEAGHMIFATHGHIYHEKNVPPLKQGDVLLHGHTHVPKCTVHETYVYVNPGSVSIPKENSEHSYLMLENGTFSWKTLDGAVYQTYSLV